MNIRLLPVLLSVFLVAARQAEAATVVDFWGLTTSLRDSSGPNIERDIAFSLEVTNPFNDVLIAALFDHRAMTGFDFEWQPEADTGTFEADYDLLVDGLSTFAASGIKIEMISDADLLIDVTQSMTYQATGGDESSFLLTFSVFNEDDVSVFAAGGESGGDGQFGAPPSGMFNISQNDIFVPAGVRFSLRSSARALSSAFVQDQDPLNAFGSVSFTMRPAIPEPMTACFLLAAAAPFVLRNRRRR